MKSFTLKEIKEVAKNLFNDVVKKKKNKAMVISLSGELGAGKTTLTQEIAGLLGIKEKVVSPTFVIMKRYETTSQDFKYLIHIDAYRLDSSQELLALGWKELMENEENLVVLEWPERVPECLEDNVCRVILGHRDERTRTIETLL